LEFNLEYQHQIIENEGEEVRADALKQVEQPTKYPDEVRPLVFMCHRRLGKSHLSALLCIERCLAQPGSEVWFTTDTTEHARDFLEGKLIDTFADMPPWISYRTRRNRYYFRNKKWPQHVESTLTIKGLDYQQGGAIRGGAADLIIIDEAREVKHLEFVVKRVLFPMFKGRTNPTMIILSTPAETLDHDFHTVYCKRAREEDSFVKIAASENPDWTEDDEKLMLGQYESKKDIGWRREIECEEIPDSSAIIVPEWGDDGGARETCLKEKLEPPPHYSGYVFCDMGYRDHSGMLFARHDFYNNQVQIIDEIFEHYKDSQELVDLLLEKINKNFPDHIRANLTIKADTTALNLADLNRLLYEKGYYALEVNKYDRDGALNVMRAGIKHRRVMVQENCVELDYQLRNGTWSKTRKNFDRSKRMGHCDLIDALVYLFRELRWRENPTPVETYPGFQEGKHWNPYQKRDPATGYDGEMIKALEMIAGRKLR
jgi:hypothetical protein